jgi:hypothetical protein
VPRWQTTDPINRAYRDAERVRASYLREQSLSGQGIPADLLNQIATEIIKRCGISPLKAHLRWPDHGYHLVA